MRRIVEPASKLGQHLLDDVPMDVGEAAFESIVIKAKAFMVQAK
jgi:hypothetical protein